MLEVGGTGSGDASGGTFGIYYRMKEQKLELCHNCYLLCRLDDRAGVGDLLGT